MLVKAGANVNIRGEFRTAQTAWLCGHEKVAYILLKTGADVDA